MGEKVRGGIRMAEFKPIEVVFLFQSNKKGTQLNVALVQQLVRCKDCKFWDGLCWRIDGHSVEFTDPNGYCSHAERRAE